MADGTKIEWTDATWNPITGCSVHSPGCTNCYAMKLAGTRMKHHPSRAGLTMDTKAGPVWNGQVRFNEQWLDEPLRWKRPRMIFVCAHADLFHENVPDRWIDQIIDVMSRCPQHTFQVLTKRADRMRRYFEQLPQRQRDLDCTSGCDWILLPLTNVWLGVSVEDQKRADERIPDLLATPAWLRWLSCEPLLGPVKVGPLVRAATEAGAIAGVGGDGTKPIGWAVVGGESGHGARPMHPDWARGLRDELAGAGVPFHFKQWGEWVPLTNPGFGHWPTAADGCCRLSVEGQRVDNGYPLQRVGKKLAGRLLDGVTHDGFPEVRA